MARRRAKDNEGQFVADDPSTPEVDEAWVEDPTAPAKVELRSGDSNNSLPERASKESIETAIKEKLSRRTDEATSNPFIPMTQLENEVKEIAKQGGFPLNRGTEVGARLIARSNRNTK